MNLVTHTLAQILMDFVQRAKTVMNPEEDPVLGPLLTQVRLRRGGWPQTKEEWEEALARLLAEIVVEGWDRYGAPGVAQLGEHRVVASFNGPGGLYTVEASSKREAYMEARREWVYRLLTQG
ncbi:hypothetical protein KZX47_13430 [Thermus sp. SYSU G05001]|uniref:Uncharacterized protein n=1 Tax=Thermus brevis TaxID=2862456 RepID=A0ABS7A1G9_9DEIN|nr:hypothetical protein [Thermus brevis]MBW6396142.1 hypothetical protein [Thermus brevis]